MMECNLSNMFLVVKSRMSVFRNGSNRGHHVLVELKTPSLQLGVGICRAS